MRSVEQRGEAMLGEGAACASVVTAGVAHDDRRMDSWG
jgi:hypothetical protein